MKRRISRVGRKTRETSGSGRRTAVPGKESIANVPEAERLNKSPLPYNGDEWDIVKLPSGYGVRRIMNDTCVLYSLLRNNGLTLEYEYLIPMDKSKRSYVVGEWNRDGIRMRPLSIIISQAQVVNSINAEIRIYESSIASAGNGRKESSRVLKNYKAADSPCYCG